MGVATVTVRNAHVLAGSLRQMGRDLADPREANRRAGQLIVAASRKYAPVRTGRLRGSIHVKDTRGRGVTVVAGEGLAYGVVQHFGWPAHNIRATLFLTKGMAEASPECVRTYQQAVADAAGKVHG